jgi:uncharacterized phage-associated protein
MFNGLYDDQRSAQVTAYLLHLGGGSMGILKLTKLLYLAERLSYERYGEPLTGDIPCALKQGPVLSTIYDRTKRTENLNETWRAWIKGREGHDVRLARAIEKPSEELLSLSRADFKVLDATWAEFGRFEGYHLASYTHSKCSEWTNPGASSHRIDPDTLLRNVGMKREDAEKQIEHLKQAGKLKRELESKRVATN